MAQVFAEAAGFDARSAGSSPAERVHPEVVDVMAEVGADIRGRVPRRLTQEDAEWADIIVTMGCGDACPYFPGKQYVDWQLDDPHGLGRESVRAIRGQIEQLVTSLAVAHDPNAARS
jgi:arsenate reductase